MTDWPSRVASNPISFALQQIRPQQHVSRRREISSDRFQNRIIHKTKGVLDFTAEHEHSSRLQPCARSLPRNSAKKSSTLGVLRGGTERHTPVTVSKRSAHCYPNFHCRKVRVRHHDFLFGLICRIYFLPVVPYTTILIRIDNLSTYAHCTARTADTR